MTLYPSKRPADGWRHPAWERQEREGAKPFEAFARYRDLGPARSSQEVATGLTKSAQLLRRWSAEWGWVERAELWDDEADRNARERDAVERAEARSEMLSSHARWGKQVAGIGARMFAQYDVSDPEFGARALERIKALTPLEAVKLIEAGAKLERQARGETGDRISQREAEEWVARFIDLALGYLPRESHEAFLRDVDSKLGIGGVE